MTLATIGPAGRDHAAGVREGRVHSRGGWGRHDLHLVRAAAAAIKPAGAEPPSAWIARNVRLPRGPEFQRPGPMRTDYFPWTRAVLDLPRTFAAKKGAVVRKAAQCGISVSMLAQMAELSRWYSGRALYMLSTKEDAADFVSTKFDPIVGESPELARLFRDAKEENRTTMRSKVAGNCRFDFCGAGSPNQASSRSYGWIWVDEWEQCIQKFPAAFGALLGFIQARSRQVRGRRFTTIFSHPKNKGEGVDGLYEQFSTRHAWCFDCPWCLGVVRPSWDLVHFTRALGDGLPDADSAELRCPHCQGVISDAQRAAAVEDRHTHAHLGGTGRLESDLDDAEQLKRPWAGVFISGLADPKKTVAYYARLYCAATTPEARRAFFNLELGEGFAEVRENITTDHVAACVEELRRFSLPGGPLGARCLVVGIDVQWPRENPTLYCTLQAFCGSGLEILLDARIVRGFSNLYPWISAIRVPLEEPGVDGRTELGVDLVAADAQGQLCGMVLDSMRLTVPSAVGGKIIKLLPVQFKPHMTADLPAREAPRESQYHPTKPQLGRLKRWHLHRDTWLGRAMRRWAEKRVTVRCDLPGDFASQITANVLIPKKTLHGWDTDERVWWKPKERRDDWALAMAYGEAGAALELGIDSYHHEVWESSEGEDADQGGDAPRRPGGWGWGLSGGGGRIGVR